MVADKNLADSLVNGIGFHHAGLSLDDRGYIEKLFISGDLFVL
jgi:replicative superfamily II helicase